MSLPSSPITKTQQKKLLGLVRRVLIHRRNKKPKQESTALKSLEEYCGKLGVCPQSAMDQGIEHLKRNSIAASMNGWV